MVRWLGEAAGAHELQLELQFLRPSEVQREQDQDSLATRWIGWEGVVNVPSKLVFFFSIFSFFDLHVVFEDTSWNTPVLRVAPLGLPAAWKERGFHTPRAPRHHEATASLGTKQRRELFSSSGVGRSVSAASGRQRCRLKAKRAGHGDFSFIL